MVTHRPCMVALLETRMHNHGSLMNEFDFSELIEVLAEGQANGMVVLWDHTKVNMHNFVRHNHEVHATIEVRPTNFRWIFLSIYASTNPAIRDNMWESIKNIADSFKGPWLVGGDFNDVFSTNEKIGGRSISRRRVLKLCLT